MQTSLPIHMHISTQVCVNCKEVGHTVSQCPGLGRSKQVVPYRGDAANLVVKVEHNANQKALTITDTAATTTAAQCHSMQVEPYLGELRHVAHPVAVLSLTHHHAVESEPSQQVLQRAWASILILILCRRVACL